MDSPLDEWAPITDADLLGPEEVEAPEVEVVVLPSPPTPTPPLPPSPKIYPRKPQPIYSAADWRVFHYWLLAPGYSIDMAAQAAGIRVYDALTSLQERDAWLYEFMVMVSPQGCGSDWTKKRRRGFQGNVGGQAKNYERETRQYHQRKTNPARQQDRRLTEDEARERFLEMLGDQHPTDRADGVPSIDAPKSAVHPATGRSGKQRVRFVSARKVLRRKRGPSAGPKSSTEDNPEGYEETTVKMESA